MLLLTSLHVCCKRCRSFLGPFSWCLGAVANLPFQKIFGPAPLLTPMHIQATDGLQHDFFQTGRFLTLGINHQVAPPHRARQRPNELQQLAVADIA